VSLLVADNILTYPDIGEQFDSCPDGVYNQHQTEHRWRKEPRKDDVVGHLNQLDKRERSCGPRQPNRRPSRYVSG
jgi:hypothetical protein